jgi:hypothetical protein
VSKIPYGQIWRHNSAGDLPGVGDAIDPALFAQLVDANKRARAKGFTYTHKPVGLFGQPLVNACAIRAANLSGFTVNLSANTIEEADELVDFGIGPVVTILPADAPNHQLTPKSRHVVACPFERSKIQCNRCKLCAKTDRKFIVGFKVHGIRARQLDKKIHLGVLT